MEAYSLVPVKMTEDLDNSLTTTLWETLSQNQQLTHSWIPDPQKHDIMFGILSV